MVNNWFAITGWAIVILLGHTILDNAIKLHRMQGKNVSDRALGLILLTLIAVWIVVAIQRGS